MTGRFLELLPGAEVELRREPVRGPSNSLVEVRDILEFARRRRAIEVHLLTALAHLPRVLTLARGERPPSLRIRGHPSELVLLDQDPTALRRVLYILGS